MRHSTESLARGVRGLAGPLLAVLAILSFAVPASAALNGTYTIGGGGGYATIDAALVALNTGVTGPVTFLIRSGTYVPPSGGWRLALVGGLSATNTVTFKPDVGATVMLTGNTALNQSGVFTLDGAKYYIIDGSNTVGGTSRNMTLLQTEVNYNPAIFFKNNADLNVVKNCILQSVGSSASTTYGYGTVYFGRSNTTSGNDSNTVRNCQIGDLAGVNRGYVGVGMYGQSTTYRNIGNRVTECEIVNFRLYGIWMDAYNSGPIIQKNTIWMTTPGTSSVCYGIYVNESVAGFPANATIDSNRIYKLMGTSTSSQTVYGIYSNTNGQLTGTTQISNNMISFYEDGYIYYYAIYLNNNTSASSALTYNISYNSIYLGGTAASFAQAMPLYSYRYNSSGVGTAAVINHRNNIYYSTRSGGSSTSYGLYIYSSPAGNWTSNNNLIQLNTDVNYYTAYYNFSLYTTLASYQTSGQDVNSVGANPQFVDPLTADLHIMTTKRTPVEGRAAVLAGQTTDYDGQTRSATTPDIGADEGAFLPTIATDATSDRIAMPLNNATIKAGTLFSPLGYFSNISSITQTVPVRMRILDASNAVVYDDLQNYSMTTMTQQRVLFNQTGNVLGSTNLSAGTYTVQLSTELVGDGDASNNTVSITINVKDPLNGIYTINRLGGGIRNFTSFTNAIRDLNALGAVGPVTFKVAGGVYDSTAETFPLTIIPAPGVNATNTVTFKVDSLASVVMTKANSTTLVDLVDADYITFDGNNSAAGNPRAFKMINTGNGVVVRFINGAQFNTLKGLHLMANNTGSNGLIHISNRSTAVLGNSDNVIQGNTLGDSAGVLRSFVNIHMLGDFSYRNSRNRIEDNDIINWGTNTNGGGYGIYWNQYNDFVKVYRNRFTQSATPGTISTGSIYAMYIVSTYNNTDSIAYNKIWNLSTLTTTSTQIGIWVNSMGQAFTTAIHNNMISLNANMGTLYGIYVTAASPSIFNIEHNTIMIRGTGTTSGYISADVRMTSSANLTVRNNILINERTYPSGTPNHLLYRSTSGTLVSNYNTLATKLPGTAFGFNGISTYTTLPAWQAVNDFNSFASRPVFVNEATGDLHIQTQPVFAGEGQGLTLGNPRDFDLQNRDMLAPDIGADDDDFNGGGLLVLSPNGGETYLPAEVLPVQFTANRIMSVRVDLSLDNGATWSTLTTVAPTLKGANTVNVTLPDSITIGGRIRVVNSRNQYEADTSNAPFRVIRKLKLLRPNGGEQFFAGDTTYVHWERRPGEMLGMGLNVDHSIDGGTTWESIVSLIPAYLDSARWIVPDVMEPGVMMRLSNIEVVRTWDTSDAPFSIVRSTLALVGPNGGEHYELNDPVIATWTAAYTAKVRLDYSSDGGSTWTTVASNINGALGTYTFTPPALPTKRARVRVVNMDRQRVNDLSDQTFEVGARSTITVYTPAAGDKFARNSTTQITWDAPEVNYVNIFYSSNNGSTWTSVASNVLASDGLRSWTVPNQNTTQGKIRVTEVGGSGSAESGVFSIVDPIVPTITLIGPDGGEKFVEGDTISITWTASDVSLVDVQFSDNGGAGWNKVKSGVASSLGIVKWVAPNKPGNNYRVRVRSLSPAASDVSNSAFEITKRPQPRLLLLYPDGGESFTVDAVVDIRWSAIDISGTLRIDWSSDDGANWDSIATTLASSGSYSWTVPDMPTKTARVRISAPNLGLSDTSNSTFEVTRKVVVQLRLLTPDGGEKWVIGTKHMITWDTTTPGVNGLKIEYAPDGITFAGNEIVANVDFKTGEYEWTVPNIPATGAALVRISNAANPGQSDISGAPFSITTPVAGFADAVAGMNGMKLLGNFPNPFTEGTDLRWVQSAPGDVEIRVYQSNGVLVNQAQLGRRDAGEQHFLIDGRDMTNGVYMYEVRIAQQIARGIMSVVR